MALFCHPERGHIPHTKEFVPGLNQTGDLQRVQKTFQQSLDMFTDMGAPVCIKVLEERPVD
jgi:hypothetical protein